MKRKTKKRIQKVMIGFMLIAVSLPLFSGFMPQQNQGLVADPQILQALVEAQQGQPDDEQIPVLPDIEGEYEVIEVIDGESFAVMYGDEKTVARLIGISVPEEMKDEALSFLKDELAETKVVGLEFDIKDRNEDEELLVYAYLPEENHTTLNSKLIQNGYAKLNGEKENVRYIEDLRSAEKEAREKKLGVWKSAAESEESKK